MKVAEKNLGEIWEEKKWDDKSWNEVRLGEKSSDELRWSLKLGCNVKGEALERKALGVALHRGRAQVVLLENKYARTGLMQVL